MKKSSIFIVVVLVSALSIPAVAGDIASFVNLGFSRDGNYFLFGQYGVGDTDGKPYAELYTVDVPNNSFAPSGVKKETYSIPAEAGQEGSGALYTLLRKSSPMIERYRINHLLTGRPVYLLTNGEEPKSRVEFRDFPTDTSYTVTLVQDSKGKENNPSSAFHIQLRCKRLGKVSTFTIGRPDYYRSGIMEYRLRKIFMAPDEEGLIFVIEKLVDREGGPDVRYMVETVSFS